MKTVDNPRGTELVIDGKSWVFAPLSLGALEKLQPALESFDGESITTVIDTAFKSLKRNYPDITRDEVADMIYLDQMKEVMDAVMNVSGLTSKGEDSGSGE